MADQSNPANPQSPGGRSDEAAERSSVNAPREHGPPQGADPPAATAADVETPAKSRPPADSPALQPGNPLFKNPFSEEANSKRTLVPYFQIMDRFQALAEEYPGVSALWQAEFGRWRVWPLPFRDAKILSEHISRSEDVPYAPGADLHLDYNAIGAVDRLIIDAGIKHDQLNKILIKDRWLATDKFSPSDLWLHSIREFWLSAQEDAEASGADKDAFEKAAQADGYVPGTSTAVGRQVWSLMASQHKSLKQIVKERQLSTGDEIERTEEPAGWVQAGTIKHVFKASVYFCGVLAARRVGELTNSQGTGLHSAVAAVAQPALELAGEVPHFVFRYGQDFPIVDQDAIEAARLEANRKFAAKSVNTFEEWMSAREEWVSELVYGAASVIGRVAVRLRWSADHRRDVLKGFIIQAASAGHLTLPRAEKFFALPHAKQLDDALFPTGSPNTATSNPSTTPEQALEQARPPRKKRGRPVEIPDKLKEKAMRVTGGKERAKILYQTPYPTVQQVKNVPTILKHFNRKRQPKAE